MLKLAPIEDVTDKCKFYAKYDPKDPNKQLFSTPIWNKKAKEKVEELLKKLESYDKRQRTVGVRKVKIGDTNVVRITDDVMNSIRTSSGNVYAARPSVGTSYAKQVLKGVKNKTTKKDNYKDSVFVLLAYRLAEGGRRVPLGYVLGSVFTHSKKVQPAIDRVAYVELACTQGLTPRKGAGSILFDELERYVRDKLGANLLLLSSVPTPQTVQFYRSRGFQRVPNACAAGTAETEELKKKARIRFQSRKHMLDPEYVNALNDHMFDHNDEGQGLALMSKCIPGPATSGLRVRYPTASSDSYPFAEFVEHTEYLWREYVLDSSGRLTPRDP